MFAEACWACRRLAGCTPGKRRLDPPLLRRQSGPGSRRTNTEHSPPTERESITVKAMMLARVRVYDIRERSGGSSPLGDKMTIFCCFLIWSPASCMFDALADTFDAQKLRLVPRCRCNFETPETPRMNR